MVSPPGRRCRPCRNTRLAQRRTVRRGRPAWWPQRCGVPARSARRRSRIRCRGPKSSSTGQRLPGLRDPARRRRVPSIALPRAHHSRNGCKSRGRSTRPRSRNLRGSARQHRRVHHAPHRRQSMRVRRRSMRPLIRRPRKRTPHQPRAHRKSMSLRLCMLRRPRCMRHHQPMLCRQSNVLLHPCMPQRPRCMHHRRNTPRSRFAPHRRRRRIPHPPRIRAPQSMRRSRVNPDLGDCLTLAHQMGIIRSDWCGPHRTQRDA